MSVEIGSLSYVSTLNNDDFQAKSLQDIKLITTRLQLTGDTSGIEKYDAAFQAAAKAELQIQKDLNAILADAKIKTQELAQAVQQPASKTFFSDSAAEVKAYQDALLGLESGAEIVSALNAQLDELAVKQNLLTDQFTAGTITEVEYNDAMLEINASQSLLVENIKRVNDAFATNVIVQNENIAGIEKTTVAVEEEIGVLEELKITLTQLKVAQQGANTTQLPIINKQIQETEASIKQFGNVGKVGFDAFGNELEQTTVKTGKFAAAIDRVTNLQNLGARVVTQFTRQIIGLGVGFLSLEIGAKAIQSLIEYIQNLDVFTGRLDQAKQNLAAFDDVMKNADQTAGTQVTSLKLLYDATQNVALSMGKRLEAAQQLRELYPTEFENSTSLAIVNGQLSKSYDELTASIIANAKSQAARTKIAQLESTILDAQFQIDKNNIDKANQLRDAKNAGNANSLTPGAGGGRGGLVNPISQQTLAQTIVNQANQANLIPTQNIAIAQGQQKFLLQFVDDVSKSATSLTNANKLLGTNLENFDNLLNNFSSKQDLLNIQSALQTKLNSVTLTDPEYAKIKADLQRVDDLLKQYSVKATTAKTDPAIALLATQTSVLQGIDANAAKYQAKAKTRDEQQVDDVIAAYTKQYNAAVAYNTKLAQFQKDHPNDKSAAALQLKPIDLSSLGVNELAAIQALSGTQSVEQTKDQVDQQKAIFKEYEAFKLQAGTDAANQLFGKELQGYTNYIDYLKHLQPTEQELTSADPYTKARAAALQDYLKTVLPQAQAQEFEENQKHLQTLIIQYQDWQQKQLTLIAKTNDDIKALNAAGFTDQAKEAQANLNDQLTALEVSGFETQAEFKKLFSDIDNLSTSSAQTLITNAQSSADALLLQGTITVDAYNKITEAINRAQQAISDRKADDLLSVGTALGEIGKSFESINTGVAKYISGLGSTITSLGNVSKAYDKFLADAGNADKQFQDGISLAATGLSALVSIIGSITSASEARKKADTDYYNSVIAFQEQYNIALDEQVRLQFQTDGNIFITKFSEELGDAAKAYKDAAVQYQTSLQALSKGQALVGQKNAVSGSAVLSGAESGAVLGATIASVAGPLTALGGALVGGLIGAIGGLFGGKKKVDVFAPLLAEYPQLIDANGKFNESLAKTLIANNQVSDATKTLLNNTISYYDEEQAAIDQINSSLQTLSDNLGTNLEDALVTAFENGTDAAKAFGSTVSDVISNIVSQFLFEDIFGSQFDKLNASLKSTVLAGGGSADITADFVTFFKDAGPLVQEFQAGLQAAKDAGSLNGLTLFPSTTTTAAQTSLSGGIQASITEDTATILEGTLNGIQLGIFDTNRSLGQMILIAQNNLNVAIQIQVNTKRSADNSDNLPAMLDQLKGINTNTAGTLNAELRAAGLN